MEIKCLEVRDAATFIPVLAVKLGGQTEAERFLLSRAGYGRQPEQHESYILLSRLDGGTITYDPFKQGPSRTLQVAHQWIRENFNALESGDVVDVQYILKETAKPKVSERED